jgi:D-methionine transport system ATP-binding protein
VSESIIQIQDLCKVFGSGASEVVALEHINLDIHAGEIFGIIGLSGAGKSTLVRCMNLLEQPTSGTIVVDGQKLAWMEPAGDSEKLALISEKELRLARRKITMIFQSFNLLMQRTCLKNVCFPMEISGVPKAQAKARAKELLELVGLGAKADAYPSQLSGGQKQRVAIARALATDPKVLLCDEATSALDPTTTASILSLLKELNQKLGVTVVVITHQMSVIEEICHRVAILDGGVIAEQGLVEDIFSNPSTDAARRLVYPGGDSPAQYPVGTHAVRVAFNGGTAYQPLIASLAIDCGVKVNILGADTRNIDGKAFGSMLLGLPDDPNEAAKALSYIRAQPNVTAEEVEYHA